MGALCDKSKTSANSIDSDEYGGFEEPRNFNRDNNLRNIQRRQRNAVLNESLGNLEYSIGIVDDRLIFKSNGTQTEEKTAKSVNEENVKRREIFKCGYTPLSRTRNVQTGNFIDCRNAAEKNSMYEVIQLATCSSSVCQIRFCNSTATGFRVGSKYIMTALHVVHAIVRTSDPMNQLEDDASKAKLLENRKVWCIFDYFKENNLRNVKKYYFEPVIPFIDESTDTAVLELKHNSYFNQMPPALDQFGFPEYTGKFTLIGHEGSLMKVNTVDIIIDKKSPTTIEDIRWVKEYNNRHTQENYEFEPHGTLTNENRILFHCKFSKGASGSPGIVVLENGSVVVVTMLLCGYPNWYYNEHVDRQVRMQWPKAYCIEQGADLISVGRIMSSKAPDLYQDIFCRRSVPVPILF